jgi:glycosyltransferase involved in cell wall biosynthesis
MNVGVVYATDFGGLAPGGISTFAWRMGAAAPDDLDVTYYLAGTPTSLPRGGDRLHVIDSLGSRGPLNAGFSMGLRKARAELSRHDVLVCHRPEYVPMLPRASNKVLVLHGGSWNAWRFGRKRFGLAYHATEILACALSSLTISVDAQSLSAPARFAARRVVGTRVPVNAEFSPPPEVPKPAPRLITTARLAREKRLHLLIDLAVRLHVPLVIMGGGPERGSLERHAQGSGADVTFLGSVPSQRIREEYIRGGIFVATSTAEGYPLAAVEALSLGVPAFALRAPGITQLEEFGLHLTDTPSELADAIQDVMRQGDNAAGRLRAQRTWAAHRADRIGADFWGHIATAAAAS